MGCSGGRREGAGGYVAGWGDLNTVALFPLRYGGRGGTGVGDR